MEKQTEAPTRSQELSSNESLHGEPEIEESESSFPEATSAMCPLRSGELRDSLGALEFEALLKLFRADLTEQVRALASAFKQGDRDRVKFLSHRIKGACLQFGAYPCAAIAEDLECAIDWNAAVQGKRISALGAEASRVKCAIW